MSVACVLTSCDGHLYSGEKEAVCSELPSSRLGIIAVFKRCRG